MKIDGSDIFFFKYLVRVERGTNPWTFSRSKFNLWDLWFPELRVVQYWMEPGDMSVQGSTLLKLNNNISNFLKKSKMFFRFK